MALQPRIGAYARNVALPGVRRLRLAGIRHDLYYRLVETPRRVRRQRQAPQLCFLHPIAHTAAQDRVRDLVLDAYVEFEERAEASA